MITQVEPQLCRPANYYRKRYNSGYRKREIDEADLKASAVGIEVEAGIVLRAAFEEREAQIEAEIQHRSFVGAAEGRDLFYTLSELVHNYSCYPFRD